MPGKMLRSLITGTSDLQSGYEAQNITVKKCIFAPINVFPLSKSFFEM